MQTQEINWLVIILPSLIAGVFIIITQILIALWLSRKTENYKKEISKELEFHRLKIQSDFQSKYETDKLMRSKLEEICETLSAFQLSSFSYISKVVELSGTTTTFQTYNELSLITMPVVVKIPTLMNFYVPSLAKETSEFLLSVSSLNKYGNLMLIGKANNREELEKHYLAVLEATDNLQKGIINLSKKYTGVGGEDKNTLIGQ